MKTNIELTQQLATLLDDAKMLAHSYCGSKTRFHLVLNDGETVSVQASAHHYCSPREILDNFGDYLTVEVGFPSFVPTTFKHFAEDENDYTETVYGRVPIELVLAEIELHGGIDVDATLLAASAHKKE